MKIVLSLAALAAALVAAGPAPAAPAGTAPDYTLSMPDPATHRFRVELQIRAETEDLVLVSPVWTPGYYQRIDYAGKIGAFAATDASGRPLTWRREGDAWHIAARPGETVTVRYEVLAETDFVAGNYLDPVKGYVSPAGAFLYPKDGIGQPVRLQIRPRPGWTVATGLEPVPGQPDRYTADDYDILYDSPILLGTLERLPAFTVRGVPHQLVGVDLGTMDRARLNDDLRRIVTAGLDLIGDVPYRHYTFLQIGASRGGIEHLNSASVGFGAQDNRDPVGRIRLDTFLAHEFFHTFNVKRIRPMELGPFDYQKENRTRLLWVSEGLTVYYETILLRRAGLTDRQALFDKFAGLMRGYENAPGRLYESLTQASYGTWEEGPFGRKGDPFNKTISYYEKGPVIGFMLDLAIRHATDNRRSLDDVMRTLYRTYYQQKGRGFTEAEFRAACESTAGEPLDALFDYVTTTKEPDYARYLGYAGLGIDTSEETLPGGWLGITAPRREASGWTVLDVQWNSPAWNAGIRRNDRVVRIDGYAPEDGKGLAPLIAGLAPGQKLALEIERDGAPLHLDLAVAAKTERRFRISPLAKTTPEQDAIRNAF